MALGDRDGYHPSPADLDRFLLGEMSPRQAAPVLAHLIHGCTRCQTGIKPLVSAMFGVGTSLPEPSPQSGSEYDFPLFKAFAAARQYAAAAKAGPENHRIARAPAPPALKNAVAVSRASTPRKLDGKADRMELDLARCRRLIDECRTLRYTDPETMVLTATLAVTLAERLDPGLLGSALLADLQARAFAELGNARRVADDLDGAEADLCRALARSAQGTGDPMLLARLMDLTASLYSDQRRFDEACLLLDAVYTIYQRHGDHHSAGRALISKGISVNSAFDVEEGARLLIQGLGMIDARRDPKLVMVSVHNLVWSLVECGQAAQARRLFEHGRQLFASYVERLDAIRSVWLEGRIAAALGEDQQAEQRFSEARASFEAARLPVEVALVSLDTAALWLRAGRTAEIMDLIEETVAIFRAHKIRRETIGTLLIVRDAYQKHQVTEALLRKVSAELLRIEDSPSQRGRVPS